MSQSDLEERNDVETLDSILEEDVVVKEDSLLACDDDTV